MVVGGSGGCVLLAKLNSFVTLHPVYEFPVQHSGFLVLAKLIQKWVPRPKCFLIWAIIPFKYLPTIPTVLKVMCT